jgi:hypothetical protein
LRAAADAPVFYITTYLTAEIAPPVAIHTTSTAGDITNLLAAIYMRTNPDVVREATEKKRAGT